MLIAEHRKNAWRKGSAQHCCLSANSDADSGKAAHHKRIEVGLFSALIQWSCAFFIRPPAPPPDGIAAPADAGPRRHVTVERREEGGARQPQ